MLYDINNPRKSLVLFNKPIIHDHFSSTRSVRVQRMFDGDVLFHYSVNGVDYKKANAVQNEAVIDDKYSYEVKYNPENPKIAYIIIP